MLCVYTRKLATRIRIRKRAWTWTWTLSRPVPQPGSGPETGANILRLAQTLKCLKYRFVGQQWNAAQVGLPTQQKSQKSNSLPLKREKGITSCQCDRAATNAWYSNKDIFWRANDKMSVGLASEWSPAQIVVEIVNLNKIKGKLIGIESYYTEIIIFIIFSRLTKA